MAELLQLLKELSPFVVLAFLGVLYFQSRVKEADALVIAAKLAADTAKYRADVESTQRIEQAEKDKQAALIQFQTVAAIAAIAGVQKLNTVAVEESEAAVMAAVETSGKVVGEQIEVARDEVIASFEENTRFAIMMLQMQLENPPATRDRTRRAVIAWTEGDMDKAQAVADEDVALADGDEELPLASGM